MRAIPNITVLSPADWELRKLYDCSFNDRGPTYIRLTACRKIVYEKNYDYKFKIVEIISGKKILILSTGSVTGEGLML